MRPFLRNFLYHLPIHTEKGKDLLLKLTFDEQQLEYDFRTLVDYLNTASREFFLFRDFQSRNIMIEKGKV